jgi:mxaJ protein
VLKQLRIGLHVVGDDGFSTPAAHALGRRGIVKNIIGFDLWDDSGRNASGRIVEAVAAGKIDLAIVWGPFGGYYAKRHPARLDVIPVPHPRDGAFPFVYEISMGVRRGDKALRAQVEEVVERRRAEIHGILKNFGVPLIDSVAAQAHTGNQED